MSIQIRYICPFWGYEHVDAHSFVDKAVTHDFHGIEINLPSPRSFRETFIGELERRRAIDPGFIFIPQQLEAPGRDAVKVYIDRVERKLKELAVYEPAFINSHTGSDHYSFDDNCRVIEAVLNVEKRTGVKILHETHRGRFSFHAKSLLPYLEKFPELTLTADLSHFCTVSESLLEDQEEIIDVILRRSGYVHARVGQEQAPQVSDPFAPEWNHHLSRFVGWWSKILEYRMADRNDRFLICPEFGPAPYMPSLPFTLQPIGNQWQIILEMKKFLNNHFTSINA